MPFHAHVCCPVLAIADSQRDISATQNPSSVSAMSSDAGEQSSGGDTDSTHVKSLPTTADQVKVPVVRQAKSLPTTADQVKVDDVYFGEASACHLKCTDGQDSTQRENFREVQHHSRNGKCPGCGTDSNLNTAWFALHCHYSFSRVDSPRGYVWLLQ